MQSNRQFKKLRDYSNRLKLRGKSRRDGTKGKPTDWRKKNSCGYRRKRDWTSCRGRKKREFRSNSMSRSSLGLLLKRDSYK